MAKAPAERRESYPHFLTIPTRWMDNDVYAHVNNVQYYSFFDTVIMDYLIREGGLDIRTAPVIGVCAESQCRFRESVAFPETVEAGLRVGHLGRRSARYEIGLFRAGADGAIAEGYFVHVFVEREAMRPVEIPDRFRGCLARIAVDDSD